MSRLERLREGVSGRPGSPQSSAIGVVVASPQLPRIGPRRQDASGSRSFASRRWLARLVTSARERTRSQFQGAGRHASYEVAHRDTDQQKQWCDGYHISGEDLPAVGRQRAEAAHEVLEACRDRVAATVLQDHFRPDVVAPNAYAHENCSREEDRLGERRDDPEEHLVLPGAVQTGTLQHFLWYLFEEAAENED